ncbi:hypothetical protein ANN_21877 [Periplaneta americana]|uniref:Uncharacterized protein n=1 Tax=Periplaneta americana TaxID=6978 RepID=A0ABQ8S727_PERAM|nr:hypothetical protein ANN_21877 [Periplaneta americana]
MSTQPSQYKVKLMLESVIKERVAAQSRIRQRSAGTDLQYVELILLPHGTHQRHLFTRNKRSHYIGITIPYTHNPHLSSDVSFTALVEAAITAGGMSMILSYWLDDTSPLLGMTRKRNWLSHWLRKNCLLKNALEGMVNGRRVRGRRRYQMTDDIKIYGSYEETKRKAENRKDWRKVNWKQYVERMSTERWPKAVLHYRPSGQRSVGRPLKDKGMRPQQSTSARAFNLPLFAEILQAWFIDISEKCRPLISSETIQSAPQVYIALVMNNDIDDDGEMLECHKGTEIPRENSCIT